jgi:hypothetical protein
MDILMGEKDEVSAVCVRWIRSKPSWTSSKKPTRAVKTKCSASWSKDKSKKKMKKNPRKTWSISKTCSKATPIIPRKLPHRNRQTIEFAEKNGSRNGCARPSP